jgi:AcrR family transcriptional regulator
LFSILLNVRSADQEMSSDGRSAIVRAAVELIGRLGVAGTTVRAVAEQAGVSAPLVIHHFGSKQGLVDACDVHVRDVIVGVSESIAEHPDARSMQALLASDEVGPSLAYVAASLQSGGEVGRWWFDQMMQLGHDMFPAMIAAGTARPVADPEMTTMLLMSMDLGLLLMRPLVEEWLGAELTDPAVLERWALAATDLLTNGFVIEPGNGGR